MNGNNYLDEKDIVFPRNVFKLKRTSSFGEIKTLAGPGNEGLNLLKWINNQIVLGNINITASTGQEAIQFQDEGTNLGTSGTVETVDFTGEGVTATRTGNKITVNIPVNSEVYQSLIQFQNEGVDLGSAGDVETIDFVGAGVNASITGSVLTVEIDSSGSTQLYEYDATDGLRVVATGEGINASWTSGTLTVSIPTDVILISARLSLSDGTNVQSSADAGGASNWIKIKFDNTTGYNTSVSDMKVPSVQKCFYAAGSPSVSNAFSIDIDNNPNMAVVGVGLNSITIRIWNLIIPNGAQFTFNGI